MPENQESPFRPESVYDFNWKKTLDEKVLVKEMTNRPSRRDRNAA